MTDADARLLQKRIADLSPERRLVLAKLLKGAQDTDGAIRPRDRRLDPPPLSYAQRQLWFLDQLAPGSWFYNESSALHLTFPIQVDALEFALNQVVARHEALRTAFGVIDDEPVQIIASDLRIPLTIVDLRHLPEAERTVESQRLATNEARAPFDLAKVPLLRAVLVRCAEHDSILLLTMHHIVFDGWSFTILLRELSQLYEARAAGLACPFSELPVQYADYAVWQRKWLAGGTLGDQLTYWRTQLAEVPALALPTDRPRPAVQRFLGARVPLQIDKQLEGAVRTVSASRGMTVFMTLLTVFKVLLARYSGQTDIVVGVPIANRHRVEVEGLIGFFVNTLVLRTDLSDDPPFEEALVRVRKVALGGFAHQDVPFEKLVEDLRPRRDLSRNPLFQVTFQIYGSGDSDAGQPVLENAPSPFEIESQTAKFDLRVDLAETAAGLNGFIEYNTDLFERATVARISQHFRRLLESAVADPAQRLSELSMLTSAERSQLLVEWNRTTATYPRDATVHQLFEAQAERTPEAVAVELDSDRVTYRELSLRANQLAHYLRRLGATAGSVVGVSTERSIEMIVSLLGIMKVGAAYLPVDIEDARERVAYQILNAQVRIVLTRERQLFHLADRGVRVVPLLLEAGAIGAESAANPDGSVGAEQLAYVMYTSGSTGRPKGVCVPHRAIVRLVCNTNFFSATAADVFLQLAPLSFDASTFEIWGALLSGARLRLFPPHVPGLDELAARIEGGVTVLWLTAALFHRMVDVYPLAFSGLRHLLTGGDVVSPAHVRTLLDACPACTVTNGYGPTENTTFTSTFTVSGPAFGDSVPIGRPIANTRVYVLDGQRRPVPVGVPGELYIAGDGLAGGYLNAPDLTALKFVPNPLPEEPGQQLYRSGDQVRFRADGLLEFIGRQDHQVKLRGFRVELGEVEATLREHTAVDEAVCMVAEDGEGDKRLIAYLAVGEQEVAVADLRRFVQQRLPEYMVPTAFVVLGSLPLNSSGKVDRIALPLPDQGRPALDVPYVSPRTETERTIAGLWQEVLGVEQVGVDDNFFDLGGHSLLVVLLHNRLTEVFRQETSIVDLFRHPTVASLARLMREAEPK